MQSQRGPAVTGRVLTLADAIAETIQKALR
jgi:hypothetical protein